MSKEEVKMTDIASLISSVGFPIVSFLLAGYFIKYIFDKYTTSLQQLTESVNNNTLVLTRLVENIDNVKEEK